MLARIVGKNHLIHRFRMHALDIVLAVVVGNIVRYINCFILLIYISQAIASPASISER